MNHSILRHFKIWKTTFQISELKVQGYGRSAEVNERIFLKGHGHSLSSFDMVTLLIKTSDCACT